MAEREHMEEQTPARPGAGRSARVQKSSLAQEIYQYLSSMVVVMVSMILIFAFVARLSVVEGASMENTLFEGDVVLVRSLFYTPEQGDVVVLTKESFQEESIVKRVIAVAGQRVYVDYAAGAVYVDGVALEEDYISAFVTGPNYPDELIDVTVPEGHIYVLGDNRGVSLDSRYPPIGLVDERCVIGQGIMVLFPLSDLGLL